MPNAIVVHSDKMAAQSLKLLLNKKGVDVFSAGSIEAFSSLISRKGKEISPALVIIDPGLPNDGWLKVYREIGRRYPKAGILFTSDKEDAQTMLRAKAHGAKFFFRAPYTQKGLENALLRMAVSLKSEQNLASRLPRINIPLRMKITLPYAFLALMIVLATTFLVSRSARQEAEERFVAQLVDTAKLTTDWMVAEEDRLLSTLRLMANTNGVADGVVTNDSERLRLLLFPIAVNAREETVTVLNATGENILTIQKIVNGDVGGYDFYRGEKEFLELPFVREVFSRSSDDIGDKYAGLAVQNNQEFFYVTGPIFDSDGNPIGVILIGKSTATISQQMRQDTLGHITLYSAEGGIYNSTLFNEFKLQPELFDLESINQVGNIDEESYIRPIIVSDLSYREIVGEWLARGEVSLGFIGVALPEAFLVESSNTSNAQIFILMVIAFGVVIVLGLWVSGRITKPLLNVVNASSQISQGNLDVRISSKGNDEIAVLAHSFNLMVDGLREGSMYRDLLGRSVSPEVRDQLRNTLNGGNLQLEGQDAMATVLFADVQGFTTLSENESPSTILDWLNELFAEIVPIINNFSGVVNEFSGDAIIAFFGILPQPLHMAESAYLACQAGMEMLIAIETLNRKRAARGDPFLKMGIGINTGPVTAGGLGAEDRMHYTIIGDTVNSTQRIEGLAHQLTSSAVMVSKQTAIAIWDHRDQFNLQPYGEHTVKGKQQKIMVYRLLPLDVEIKPGSLEFLT